MKPADCTQTRAPGLSRRELLARAGSGLFLWFSVDGLAAQEPARLPARQGYPTDINAYLRIGPDGRVTCFSGKGELGRGAMTASWMAARMRTCAPQRHRLSSMWRAICSGVGLGVLSNSA